MKTITAVSLAALAIMVLLQPGGTATPSAKEGPDLSVLSDPAAVVRVARNTYLLSSGIRDLASRKPVAFTSEGLVLPPGFNGEMGGFTMVHVRTGGLLDRMGLRKGDVLFAVNGMPLRDFSDSRKAARKLKNAARISLSVMRDGATVALNYEFRDVG